MSQYLIQMKRISKKFHNEVVLDSVDLSIKSGEIHGLLGGNGAGKSVLMKILSGIYKPDDGEIFFEERKVEFSGPRDTFNQGITMIYQDINLMDELSVAENILSGQLPTKGKLLKMVDWQSIYSESERILKSLNFYIDVKRTVKGLNAGQKQMVEIAKALSKKAKVIIMDEPYTGLTQPELDNFFDVVRKLKSTGISIIYISHRMDDVLKLCDSITILEDGKVVADFDSNQIDRDRVIQLMTGKAFKDNYPKLNSKPGRVTLRIEDISTERGLKNVSFNLRKGEVLGIAGLLGSGRTAIARAIFGLDKLHSGNIYLNETLLNIKSPETAINAKIGYMVEDRLESGLRGDFGIPENISLANLKGIKKFGIILREKEKSVARGFIKRFVIKTPKVEQNIMTLSGGSQQKVLLSRWIFTDSNILILDEPTKGVDTSTKVELYNFMNKYISYGCSIILISSDIYELMGMSDRIIVLFNGEVRKELPRNQFSKERILFYASGG